MEIFTHLAVSDLGHFLELQRQLLPEIMEVIAVRGRASRQIGATRLGAQPRRRMNHLRLRLFGWTAKKAAVICVNGNGNRRLELGF